MAVQREEREIYRNVGNAGIRFKNCKDAEEGGDHEKGLSPDSDSQTSHISSKMQPEDPQEKFPKRIEYLNEEIPPKSNVWCEIGYQQLNTVSGRDELPRVSGDDIRYVQESSYAGY